MAAINFSGLASGIDSTALIQAQSDATRKARVTPYKDKISELQDENTALNKVKEKLRTIQEKAKVFSTLSGGGLAKTGSSSDETVATASASSSAINGSYSVTVTQVARNGFFSFGDRFAGSTTVINSSINNSASSANRTVTVTVGTGSSMETVSVELTNTSTAGDFVSSFNSSSTKAEASLVNVGSASSPSYAIVISSSKTGTQEGQLAVSVGSEVSTAGTGAFTSNTLSASTNAADAQFTVSGITGTISRSTNSVADVITGVTFNVQKTGTATVTIGDDVSTTTSRVQEYVDAFNDLVSYIKENNQITREEDGQNVKNIFGPLASTRTDDTSLQSLRDAISATSLSSGQSVRIFADLGITTERDGTLKFNKDTFKTAIATSPSNVNSLLTNYADTVSTTGGTIDVMVRFNGLLDISINSNDSQVKTLNERIAEAEASIAKQEEAMKSRFARLESIMSQLQSQQNQLNSALAGL